MTSFELYTPALTGAEHVDETDSLRPSWSDPHESRARRVLNVVVASIGLLVVAPVMAAVAILVKLTSPGPILYRQVRVGVDRRNPRLPVGNHRRAIDYGGAPFTIYKFRTMAAAASRSDRQVWAHQNDVRVTPLGRILRKYRLDELPQLFNVLKGDMNIVGPRPEQPTIFAGLRTQVHDYTQRQRVRPGITGWAQINHHYDVSVEDVRTKVALDLEYIARQSFMEDLKIMLRTAPVLVFKKGGW
ncbi:MAG TPA: sugar transferase [Gemmatimonadales bacterium]|jgi:lipopolysaccharide/colanic/teichoic acid biosynthesis glycosyltransferase